MRIITIFVPPDLWGEYVVPHNCANEMLHMQDFSEALTTMQFETIVLKPQKWEIPDLKMTVRIWTGECDKCGQDYQAWRWRYWTDDEARWHAEYVKRVGYSP